MKLLRLINVTKKFQPYPIFVRSFQICAYRQYAMERHFPGLYSSTCMWLSSRSRHNRKVWEYSTWKNEIVCYLRTITRVKLTGITEIAIYFCWMVHEGSGGTKIAFVFIVCLTINKNNYFGNQPNFYLFKPYTTLRYLNLLLLFFSIR